MLIGNSYNDFCCKLFWRVLLTSSPDVDDCTIVHVNLHLVNCTSYGKHANFQRANEMFCDMDLNNILDPTDIQTSWLCLRLPSLM